MALEGLHHVTAITADAPRNVDFHARLLGLRLIKKTVNFDQPDVYHLYYGDERGTPGSVLTFFEFPAAAPGRHGDGMPYRIAWRVAGEDALDFWPLVAAAADVPAEHALRGFAGVRAYAGKPAASAGLLSALGFAGEGGAWELAGSRRRARWSYDAAPGPGAQGAGSIHHVAWSAADDVELARCRSIASAAGARPTPIVDRRYFHSVYLREPSGVLFELASRDIGFDVDEPLESLGHGLMLPPQHEPLREQLVRRLAPIANPRAPA